MKVCERGVVERERRNNLDTFNSSELLKRYRCLCHNQAATPEIKVITALRYLAAVKTSGVRTLGLLQPSISRDRHSSHSITVISSTLTLYCKTYTIPLFTRPQWRAQPLGVRHISAALYSLTPASWLVLSHQVQIYL